MSVARRLALALALHLALLGAVLILHVRTIRQSVGTSQEISEVSARLVLASARQRARLAELDETIAKYGVTRDAGYRAKFLQLHAEFDGDLAQLRALPVSDAEGAGLAAVERAWEALAPFVGTLAARAGARVPTAPEVAALHDALATVRSATDAAGVVAQATMRDRLARSAEAARQAELLSWSAVTIALLVAVLTTVGLVRAITDPLRRLAAGTREVARGRFAYRLDTSRGDEFARVAEAFNRMTEQLGALDRMKADFVSMVSHDLKSPLASVRETNGLLMDELPGPLTAAQRRVLALQRESADRLSRMIAKLLDLSRLESGLPLEAGTVEVAALIGAAVAHATIAAEGRARIVARIAVAPGTAVRGDADQLRQVLDNLLENAVKFSPDGGEVVVRATRRDEGVVIAVEDEGPGVPPEDRERIFERFVQTAAGRNVPGRGVGLGLTICRGIVQAHGGRIAAVPREPGGSAFIVELPTAAPPDAARTATPDAPAEVAA